MEVMMPPNDGQGNRPGQRRRARGGCLPQWPWAELSLPLWGSGLGLVTSFPARVEKWTLGRWDKGLVEVGGAGGKNWVKTRQHFCDIFLGRKCGEFSPGFGCLREFAKVLFGVKKRVEKDAV